MPHPDEGLIHAWLDGELGAAEGARVAALVESDAAWAAAAAEARGLIAASARIVGALDRVPGHVTPKTSVPAQRAARRWIWRAAAALVLVAGSAVVLRRGVPELRAPERRIPEPAGAVPGTASQANGLAASGGSPQTARGAATAKQGRPEVAPAPPSSSARDAPARAVAPTGAVPAPPAESRSRISDKVLDAAKQSDARREQGLASTRGTLRENAAGTQPRAASAPGAAPQSVVAGAPPLQALAQEKTTWLPASCFEQRAPRDSASRIIRLESGALADSIRLARFTLRGDTLAAVNGPLIAVRVRCPGP